VDDDWRTATPDDESVDAGATNDAPTPPASSSRYQLDIDKPLIQRAAVHPTGSVERGSLTWAKVTPGLSTGSVDTIVAPRVLLPSYDDAAAPVAPTPQMPAVAVPSDDELTDLAMLVGQIVADAPVEQPDLPSGAPIHRATRSTPALVPITPVVAAPAARSAEPVHEPAAESVSEPIVESVADVVEPTPAADPVTPDFAPAQPTVEPAHDHEIATPAAAVDPATAVPVDTLAGLPDAPPSDEVDLIIEVDDPVQVPIDPRTLTLSNAAVYQPAAPSLARPAAALTFTPDVLPVRPRRKRRSPFGAFIKLVVVLAILGGGAFAVQQYVLTGVRWSADLAEPAAVVERSLGLTFEDPVPVEVLSLDAYAPRLGSWLADAAGDDWTAFGVAPGGQPTRWVGRGAVLDTPVFYDPATRSLVEVEGVPAKVRELALIRALSAALLDQRAKWSEQLGDLGLAQRVGYQAVLDGVGRNAAQATLRPGDDKVWNDELFEWATALPAATESAESPYLTAMVGRPGLASQAVTDGLQGDALIAAVNSPPKDDAVVIDPARGFEPAAAASTSRGMMFWYASLAGRIDPNLAWRAVAGWRSDEVLPVDGAAFPCWSALIRMADGPSADVLNLAFQSWADISPGAETVTRADTTTVNVVACVDPSFPLSPIAAAPALGGAPVERALLADAAGSTPLSSSETTCLLTAARDRAVPFTDAADAAPAVGLAGWTPPWVTANADLVDGCRL
jgi:hypothetical protein